MEESLISKFTEYGADQKTVLITVQVYLELCEVKRYYDINSEYNNTLQKIILKAKKRASEPYSLFIPLPVYEDLNFKKVQELLDHCQVNSLYIVLVHPDSTCVYYELAKDLLLPLKSGTTGKHRRVSKQDQLNNWISKNKETVKQAALCQMPLVFPKNPIETSEPSSGLTSN